ncbi:hypothetical protein SAMN05660284_02671 [Formivibrio citricus]|uniref:Extracellular solute-binding protein, family 3 n=1 Tax=Formivibrio citricus TaxID=83765 RepID=A0A1I5DIG1_9NEIS|nr:hypothetical protein [Formivibrio citricus]SFN99054.1 hypothetical protein SAMN05660284_02671 [Formivibrio citricus]
MSKFFARLFFRGKRLALFCFFCIHASHVAASESPAPVVLTHTSAESAADTRQLYNIAALRLALEKTRAEYGDYRLQPAPRMNTARALEEARRGTYPNFMVMTSFQNHLLDAGLDYARFPVDLGITGFRICFVSPTAKTAASQAKTLDEIRHFSVGQGVGWADVAILRHNQFKVVTVPVYEDLFLRVAANNFDLFCRGINELEAEYDKRRTAIPGLDYDRSFVLSYPLPRFFFSGKGNGKALERVGKGLQMAYKDGSLRKLWREHYQHAINFSKLKQRKIFQLETPNIDRIDFDYRKYFFDPRRD